MFPRPQTFILLAALSLPMAHGAYTYVDATTSNTTLDGAALVHGTNVVADGSAGSSTDNFWTFRTGVTGFQDSNYFESDNANVSGDRESTGNLVTTITLSAIGTYDIVAVFTRSSLRDIAARIGSAPTAGDIFTAGNALNADQALLPAPAIVFDSSYLNARGTNGGAAYLGQITTTGINQTVSIYINGFDSLAGTQDERTQYEGIGFQLVPEPSTALLGGLGLLALLRRRR
jgi:hypothetical protein